MNNKQQKEYFIKIADHVRHAGKLYADCLLDPGLMTDNLPQIDQLEADGDSIQKELDDHFKNARNIPYLAIDRVKLLNKIDNALDALALGAKTYATFHVGLPEDFVHDVDSLAKQTKQVTDLFAQAVEVIYSSFKDAIEITTKIEEIRDTAMNEAFQLEARMFTETDEKVGWKQFTAFREVVKKTMRIITATKEASEILEIMAFKYD